MPPRPSSGERQPETQPPRQGPRRVPVSRPAAERPRQPGKGVLSPLLRCPDPTWGRRGGASMSKQAGHRLMPGSWHQHQVGLCPVQAADRDCAHPQDWPAPSPKRAGGGGLLAASLCFLPAGHPEHHPPPPSPPGPAQNASLSLTSAPSVPEQFRRLHVGGRADARERWATWTVPDLAGQAGRSQPDSPCGVGPALYQICLQPRPRVRLTRGCPGHGPGPCWHRAQERGCSWDP